MRMIARIADGFRRVLGRFRDVAGSLVVTDSVMLHPKLVKNHNPQAYLAEYCFSVPLYLVRDSRAVVTDFLRRKNMRFTVEEGIIELVIDGRLSFGESPVIVFDEDGPFRLLVPFPGSTDPTDPFWDDFSLSLALEFWGA